MIAHSAPATRFVPRLSLLYFSLCSTHNKTGRFSPSSPPSAAPRSPAPPSPRAVKHCFPSVSRILPRIGRDCAAEEQHERARSGPSSPLRRGQIGEPPRVAGLSSYPRDDFPPTRRARGSKGTPVG